MRLTWVFTITVDGEISVQKLRETESLCSASDFVHLQSNCSLKELSLGC